MAQTGGRKTRGLDKLPLYMQATAHLDVIPYVIHKMGILDNPWQIDTDDAFGVALQDAINDAHPAEHYEVTNGDAVWEHVSHSPHLYIVASLIYP